MSENNDHAVKVTKDEVIADLSLTNLGLKRLLSLLSDENDKLQVKVVELEKQLEKSLGPDWIAEYVEQQFRHGRILLPLQLRNSNGLTEVSCNKQEIRFLGDGIIVPVHFINPALFGIEVAFIMKLVPTVREVAQHYPGFKLEYEKPIVKPIRKHKKKAEGPKPSTEPKADTSR